MCSAVDSPVSPSVAPAVHSASMTIVGSGPNSPAPFGHFNHDGSWSRTSPASSRPTAAERSEKFFETWPRSGMMRDGIVFPLPSVERRTNANVSGSWPTPRVTDVTGGPRVLNEKGQRVSGDLTFGANLADSVRAWTTPTVDDANNVTRTSGDMASCARETFQWGTPNSTDGKGGSSKRTSPEDQRGELRHQLGGFADGMMASPSKAQTDSTASSPAKPLTKALNPNFGLWLMGFPVAWLDSAPLATRSSRAGASKAHSDSLRARKRA